eukprot:TRINITY_DN47320_c0_g1_i2.p1 TRINITY_DN47320_c0_g1~~TRINITY_DN47320_c0_g1_i2.p1  ORF type:complete len:349 (-),score=5.06 TRINITY_DN47320_c0_g1_i2:76-1122(-)
MASLERTVSVWEPRDDLEALHWYNDYQQKEWDAAQMKFWLFVPARCGLDAALLHHFLHHYLVVLAINRTQISMTLYGEQHECNKAKKLLQSYSLGKVTISKQPFSRCQRLHDLFAELDQIQMGPRDWWVQRDIDEFMEVPPPFTSLVAMLQDHTQKRKQRRIIVTGAIDRIAPTGELSTTVQLRWRRWRSTSTHKLPKIPAPDMHEQFPLCCLGLYQISRCSRGGLMQKIFAMGRTFVPASTGMHTLLASATGFATECPETVQLVDFPNLNKRHIPVAVGRTSTLQRLLVSHFRWTSDALATTRAHKATNPHVAYNCMEQLIVNNSRPATRPKLMRKAHCETCWTNQV